MAALRPIYLVGHNTNSIAEIEDGLARGLNAFEIDINKDEHDELFVSHGPVNGATALVTGPCPRLVPFLLELKRLVSSPAGSKIALVIFDCKISDPALAVELVDAVRTCLTGAGSSLPVIYSVPALSDARTFFEPIQSGLQPREALMIDEEGDPRAVATFFAERGVVRAAYGNGITTVLGVGLPSPRLVAQMEEAVALAALGFVYAWVLVAAGTMRRFLRAGVSGVMVDTSDAETLVRVLEEPEFSSQLRRATRDDDPLARRD
ncbi:MAG TPA: hypothetical protein VGK73_18455 [Polyangiaceae bacterium]